MSLLSSTVVNGPEIHADGSRRGVMDFTFDDGRVERKVIKSVDDTAWESLVASLPDIVELAMQEQDADEASDQDVAIDAVKQASIKQVALAFLRRAYSEGDPYLSYLKFTRFNDYRNTQGWTLDQVVANLSEVGLTQDEWDLMRARYTYLVQSAVVTAMENYQTVLSGDTWGEEFR